MRAEGRPHPRAPLPVRVPSVRTYSPRARTPSLAALQEVISASQALDGRHRSDYDADELGEEERERKLRTELNRAFRKFVERVEDIAKEVRPRGQRCRVMALPCPAPGPRRPTFRAAAALRCAVPTLLAGPCPWGHQDV